MQQMFSRKVRFKDSDGNDYPNWSKVNFADVFKFLRTNSFSRAKLADEGDVMNIHYGDIHKMGSSFYRMLGKLSYAPVSAKASGDICKNGDLVVADASEDRTDVGKSVEIVDVDNCLIVAGLHTFLCRQEGRIAPGFAGYLMQSQEVKRHLWKIATGASVHGISKTELSKCSITLPTVAEQKKIADFLSALDHKIHLLEKQQQLLEEYKNGLLQQMFVS